MNLLTGMSFFRGRGRTSSGAPITPEDEVTESPRRVSESTTSPSPGKGFLREWFQKLKERPKAADDSAISEDETSQPAEETEEAPTGPGDGTDNRLTWRDLHVLFLGAPYFLQEQGKYGQWYPQVLFPWSEHDLSVQNLWDRKPLSHASFTLCTLHAHLPVPDGLVVEGDTPVNLHRTSGPKRAVFDVGVFEVPNMLSFNGKEPGSVGFRHFLELPVADSVQYTGPAAPRPRSNLRDLSTMPATQAYESVEHHAKDPYAQCLDGTVHDRKQLLCEGPSAWKHIGVRDPSIDTIIERLEMLRSLRYETLHTNVNKTILDVQSPNDLHNQLYTRFLYSPPRSILEFWENPHSLKSQIRMLAVVLASPGAWVDFSLEEWRLRVGQLLWESVPHRDGDCFYPGDCEDAQKRSWVTHGLERKWLLLQMLLAGELLIRLDAVVRAGILQEPEGITLTAVELEDFNKLCDRKVKWDLIVVCRFFDSFDLSRAVHPGQENSQERRHSIKGLFQHRSSSTSNPETESGWECKLTPFHVNQQLQGLFVFADSIGWPGIDVLKERLESKVGDQEAVTNLYSHPVQATPDASIELSREETYSRSSHRQVLLRNVPNDQGIGWITRSWLSGFVPPGEVISQLLMSTVLENDPEALRTLGPLVNLHGGFSYRGHSWWSKNCVVGRVVASLPGTKECMGWIRSDVLPSDGSNPLDNTWFEIRVQDVPSTTIKKARIKQGNKVARQSTPMGDGDLSREAFSLPVDEPGASASAYDVTIDLDGLSVSETASETTDPHLVVNRPGLSFTVQSESVQLSCPNVSWPLSHNVHFITSHECRPPVGQASQHGTVSSEHARVPGHPLHAVYHYRYIRINELPSISAPPRLLPGNEKKKNEVLIVDARGSPIKETFARSWCASVGTNAVIARVGRTCLGCSIREARAVDVGVVIRVGDGAWQQVSRVYPLS